VIQRIVKNKVVIVGLGYVGLPLAMAACDIGLEVVGLDIDQRKIDLLKAGVSYVEDVDNRTLQRHLSSGSFLSSTDYAVVENFDVAVITVPTPLTKGLPDLSFIEDAANALSPFLSEGSTVILESTTYPGTTEELLIPALESNSNLKAGKEFFVGYSPERIDPGNKNWTLITTPKVTSGVNSESLKRVNEFYESLGIQTVPVKGTKEAELTKLLENTFRHVNIALVNELCVFADQIDVDVWEAIRAAESKPFGFMKFLPGPGVGGHCLPVDPSYLSWAIKQKTGSTFQFVELANSINQNMPRYVVQRAARLIPELPLSKARALLVGLSYKPNTGDVRESPALDIARLLIDEGTQVFGLDEHVNVNLWPQGIIKVDEQTDEVFDIILILNTHDGVNLTKLLNSKVPVLDTRNSIDGPDHVETL
jgi:nucleotide sugar dehydrogenase